MESLTSKLKFYAQALVDIYGAIGLVVDGRLEDINPLSFEELDALERLICKEMHAISRHVVDIIRRYQENPTRWQIKWHCDIIFNKQDPLSQNYIIDFQAPTIEESTSLYNQRFGCDRFLFVSISGLPSPFEGGGRSSSVVHQFWRQHWAPHKLFCDGLLFGGRKFYFLGGEMEKNGGSSGYRRKQSLSATKDKVLVTWFFNEVNNFQYHSIHDVRNHFGQLSSMPPGKCNARIKLGFSSIYPLNIGDANVIVVPDVISTASQAVMTDGCGFISADLAQHLPYSVHHGALHKDFQTARNQSSHPHHQHMPTPAIIQVRCTCSQGLFKGCLLVIHDPQICPPNTIIFRTSMQKALKSTSAQKGLFRNHPPLLGLVDTFEHAAWLEGSGSKSGRHRDVSQFTARLNRQCCLLLRFLGVPEAYFTSLMTAEIDRIVGALMDRQLTYRLAKEVISDSIQLAANQGDVQIRRFDLDSDSEVENDEDSDEDEGDEYGIYRDDLDDEETDNTTVHDHPSQAWSAYFVKPNHNHANVGAEEGDFYLDRHLTRTSTFARETQQQCRILDMLLAGHSLEEPYLQQLLRTSILARATKLLKCNLKVHSAINLVGAPDPYGFLAPDEVYLSFPDDRVDVSCVSSLSTQGFEGRCVVTRNPMHHPGDVRVLRAVRHPQLEANMRLTNGGVIFFSVRGVRAPADEMSGGDYDGDKFLVLYGRDDVVQCVKACAPYVASTSSAPTDQTYNHNCTNTETALTSPSSSQVSSSSPPSSMRAVDEMGGGGGGRGESGSQPFSPFSSLPNSQTSPSSSQTGNYGKNNNVSVCSSQQSNCHGGSHGQLNPGRGKEVEEVKDHCRGCTDSFGWQILSGLLLAAQWQHVGRYSNAWMAWADRHPLSREALRCAEIVRIALDAAKSGELVPHQPDLIVRAKELPVYLRCDKFGLEGQQRVFGYQQQKPPQRQPSFQTTQPTTPRTDNSKSNGQQQGGSALSFASPSISHNTLSHAPPSTATIAAQHMSCLGLQSPPPALREALSQSLKGAQPSEWKRLRPNESSPSHDTGSLYLNAHSVSKAHQAGSSTSMHAVEEAPQTPPRSSSHLTSSSSTSSIQHQLQLHSAVKQQHRLGHPPSHTGYPYQTTNNSKLSHGGHVHHQSTLFSPDPLHPTRPSTNALSSPAAVAAPPTPLVGRAAAEALAALDSTSTNAVDHYTWRYGSVDLNAQPTQAITTNSTWNHSNNSDVADVKAERDISNGEEYILRTPSGERGLVGELGSARKKRSRNNSMNSDLSDDNNSTWLRTPSPSARKQISSDQSVQREHVQRRRSFSSPYDSRLQADIDNSFVHHDTRKDKSNPNVSDGARHKDNGKDGSDGNYAAEDSRASILTTLHHLVMTRTHHVLNTSSASTSVPVSIPPGSHGSSNNGASSSGSDGVRDLCIDCHLLLVYGDESSNHAALYASYFGTSLIAPVHVFAQYIPRIEDLFPLYADLWTSYCLESVRSYKLRLVDILSTSPSSSSASSFPVKKDLSRGEKTHQCHLLKQQHITLFGQRAQQLAQERQLPLLTARLRLAGLIYLATYLDAAHKRQRYHAFATKSTASSSSLTPAIAMTMPQDALSYCWEICGLELHRNKCEAVKKEEGLSPLHVLPWTELMYLLRA